MAACFRDNAFDKSLCLAGKEKNIQEHFKLVGQNAYTGNPMEQRSHGRSSLVRITKE